MPSTVHAEPVTGRVFVFIAKDPAVEPRLQGGGVVSVPFFGTDVCISPRPVPRASVGAHAVGYPYPTLDQLPAGDYYYRRWSALTRIPARGWSHDLGPHG